MLPASATASAIAAAAPAANGPVHVITVIQCTREPSGNWNDILTQHSIPRNVDIIIMKAPFSLSTKEYDNAFKKAIEHAGFRWMYHGSKWKGHDNMPEEFKGAVLLRTKAADAKNTIGGMLTALGVNHVFHDKVQVGDLYFHPLLVPELLEELGVPYERVLAWREANLTPKQLTPTPRTYSNPEMGSYFSADANSEVRSAHMASRVEPTDPATSGVGSQDMVSRMLERLHALDAKVLSLEGGAGPSSLGAELSSSAAAVVPPSPAGVRAASATPAAIPAASGSAKRSRAS
jgi:hypothetical protein